MPKKLNIVLAQINPLVGDIDGNLQKHLDAARTAQQEHKADLIVFPELSLTGYPPEDLLLRKDFIQKTHDALQILKAETKDIHCLVGHPHHTSQGMHNVCSLLHNNSVLGRYAKQHLPNEGVFDERRYFVPGQSPCVIPIRGIPTGIIICEDLWHPAPFQQAANLGARLILIPNASPFEVEKHERRVAILSKRAKLHHVSIVYVNQVGGQDELLFDGGSIVSDEMGNVSQCAGFFQETLHPVEMEISSTEARIPTQTFTLPTTEAMVYQALVMGVRDYVRKNHFSRVILGVSGGIDSALTLAIATDALGKENVHAIMMPSRYTANISTEDAITLANNLGVKHEVFSIEPSFKSFLETMHSTRIKEPSITEENLQSRCRCIILMALSNQTGSLVLATGNRSEMAVGYATLYGDMGGALAVLKDIPKTLVYQLAKYRNQLSAVIPERTLTRAPTAELAPNQKDEDSLPPYEILDKILFHTLNQEQSIEEIVAQGFDRATVEKIVMLIQRCEYKRRQSPIGLRINRKAFGRDRRYPITNGFKG